MRRSIGTLLAGALATASLGAIAALGAAPAVASRNGLDAVGLTADQKLVWFDTERPNRAQGAQPASGLSGDGRVVGIDYRVQDRKLYGVGDKGGVYTLTKAGKATKVSQLTVGLEGALFGVDFNPAADRLRIISDTGQNLRHDVNPGGATVADGALTYPPAPARATGVTGAAYTNNDLDASTATTLFDLDTMMDQIAIQAPANAGPLSATGKLGADVGADAGFDIYSRISKGKTVEVSGFATVKVGDRYRLWSISLLTGAASDRGAFGSKTQVVDLAVELS